MRRDSREYRLPRGFARDRPTGQNVIRRRSRGTALDDACVDRLKLRTSLDFPTPAAPGKVKR
jgi:hypothetical protein